MVLIFSHHLQPFPPLQLKFSPTFTPHKVNEMISSSININTFPNDKMLKVFKLQAFADNKSIVPKKTISVCDRVENTEGEG